MFNPNNIFDQFTGHNRQSAGGLGDMLGGLLGGRSGGGLAGGLDALSGGARASDDGGFGRGGTGGLGGGSSGGLGGMFGGGGGSPMGGLGGMLGAGMAGGMGGGLLGSILGGASRNRGGGGGTLMRMGGAAVLTALAARAFKAWQEQQSGAQPAAGSAQAGAQAGSQGGSPWGQASLPGSPPAGVPTAETPAADDHPFGLAVVRAMIAAAKADGSIDGQERERIFAEVEKLQLDDEEKGFVFEALNSQSDPMAIARLATNDAQKAELYLASRLVAAPDTAAERAWLDALAHGLNMPAGLRQSLDAQAKEAAQAVEEMGRTQA